MVIQSVEIENQDEVLGQLNNITSMGKDLTPLLGLLVRDFYKTQRNMVFRAGQNVAGRGKYKDLKQKTKDQKRRQVGFVYPIMVRSRRLERSLTIPGSTENITKIGKLKAQIGTKVPYAIAHQKPSAKSRLPKRPVIIPELYEKRWMRTIEQYAKKMVGD